MQAGLLILLELSLAVIIHAGEKDVIHHDIRSARPTDADP
jgi:hypothetical protein